MNKKNNTKCEIMVTDRNDKSIKYKCGAHATTMSNVKVEKRLLDCCNAHRTVYCQATIRAGRNPRTSRQFVKKCPLLAVTEYQSGVYYCQKHLDEAKEQEKVNLKSSSISAAPTPPPTPSTGPTISSNTPRP